MRLHASLSPTGFLISASEQSIALPILQTELPGVKAEGVARKLHLETHHSSGVWEWQVVHRNERDAPITLSGQSSLRIRLDTAGKTPNHWWVEKGAGWSSEVGTHTNPITSDYKFRGRFTGYSPEVGEEMIPWSAIVDPASGDGWILALAHSGNGRIEITRVGDEIVLETGLDWDEAYRTVVKPQETYRAPVAYLMPFKGGLDEGVYQWHRFVQEHLRPHHPDKRFPLLVNNSWGSEMVIDEKLAHKMIDDAADLGLEMFQIDAGWFRGLGNWHEDEAKFPHGIAPISDYAHKKGLLSGLWVAWTQGDRLQDQHLHPDEESAAFDNPTQHTWFGKDYAPSWQKVLPYIGADICLACEDARKWCLKELERIVREAKIDLLEHDQRMIVNECIRTDHGHMSHPADISYHSAEGYNWVYDELRKTFPHLIFENCVNGGRMVDFSALQRCHYVCISDSYDQINLRRSFYDSSYAIPPMMCETYVNNQPGTSCATFLNMIRSAMMGFCNVMIDTGKWPSEWRDLARDEFHRYKTWIRPLIVHGHLYHVSERPDGKRWDGMQYHDPKTGRGVVFAFRGSAGDVRHTFPLRGLDPHRSYKVTFSDRPSATTVAKGSELMVGLVVTIPEAGTSEIVTLEAA